MWLESLGEQPVEYKQFIVPQISGCFDVEAVLGLDLFDIRVDVSPGGVKQAVVSCRGEVEASISSEQRHGEVVSGMSRLRQFSS